MTKKMYITPRVEKLIPRSRVCLLADFSMEATVEDFREGEELI